MLYFDGIFLSIIFIINFREKKKLQSYIKDEDVFCLEKIDLKDV